MQKRPDHGKPRATLVTRGRYGRSLDVSLSPTVVAMALSEPNKNA
ncbi:MAG TPA: hypothetical protein VG454_15200 [Gemmatimonadales bacterium]|nr:hypothetical protein [Gemmatimonadales bacterium]